MVDVSLVHSKTLTYLTVRYYYINVCLLMRSYAVPKYSYISPIVIVSLSA